MNAYMAHIDTEKEGMADLMCLFASILAEEMRESV